MPRANATLSSFARIIEYRIMRLISRTKAKESLSRLRAEFEAAIRREYEHRAKPCAACETPGACCLDAHFVNVRISRLEAEVVKDQIDRLDLPLQGLVASRVDSSIERYRLDAGGDTAEKKYACPLFEPGTGCLVHETGKPAACVVHACYDDPRDLPPEDLLAGQELRIDDLNARTYGRRDAWLPIPLAIRRITSR